MTNSKANATSTPTYVAAFPPGCVAFVTGAGSGLGNASALQFARDGVQRLALVDVDAERLEATAAALRAISPDTHALSITADCCKEDDVQAAIDQTVREFGRIDVCCNAAGIAGRAALTVDLEDAECREVIELNMMGLWYCQRAQIRQMRTQAPRPLATGLPHTARGVIVNIGSAASVRGFTQHGPYTMAKHAVLGLTRADAIDHASDGIRINCICPGYHRTNIAPPEVWDAREPVVRKTVPLARFGDPAETGYLASFLASDRSSFITGQDVVIDGGLILR